MGFDELRGTDETNHAFISGIGKATNFKFCTHIHSIRRKKSPIKISGKVAVGEQGSEQASEGQADHSFR